MEMADGQACEKMPYFMWMIEDIDSKQVVKSPIFNIDSVKFLMVYHPVIFSELYEIYMVPVVEDPKSTLPSYTLKASISIVSADKQCRDLLFTQNTESTNIKGKGNSLRHVLWLLSKHELLYNLDKIVEEQNGMNSVTFLCVFGQLCEYQKYAMHENPWFRKQCLRKFGQDLENIRLNTDPNILLKCGKKEIKAHEFILSARSQKFADKFNNKNMTRKEVEIEDMEFEVLEHFITYIYSGRLRDCSRPTVDMLKKLYYAADEYKVDSLKEMVSFKLLENINDPIFICSCSMVDKKELSSSPVTVDKKELVNVPHLVKKYEFCVENDTKCKALFTNIVLQILLMADRYDDKKFKGKIMLSIVNYYDFILNTREWHYICPRYKRLSSEIYKLYFDCTRESYNIP